ncbi:MAG: hypothetical protein ACTHLA_01545 [Asticcacaulis sp.]|uniref:hypothetical protein n=1 Tax=Asticcacaulis sp. TaxID=1872648 RepID=UPI003F7C4212
MPLNLQILNAGKLAELLGYIPASPDDISSRAASDLSNVETGRILRGHDTAWIAGLAGGNYAYLRDAATFNGIADLNEIAVSGIARSSAVGTGASASIGVAGFSIRATVGDDSGSWALYGTARREAGVLGVTQGLEIDASCGDDAPAITPYNMFPASGQVVAAWVAAGGESASGGLDQALISAHIGILSNDATHTARARSGVVFHQYALEGSDGLDADVTNAEAVALARRHALNWYDSSGAIKAQLLSSVTTAGGLIRMEFGDDGVLFSNGGGVTAFQAYYTATSVNGLLVNCGAGSGQAVELAAQGSDADIAFNFRAKGGADLGAYGQNISLNALGAGGLIAFSADGSFVGYVSEYGINLSAGKNYAINDHQVVGERKTGWSRWTGVKTRSEFDTATATVEDVAQVLGALIDDLYDPAISSGHGLIAA